MPDIPIVNQPAEILKWYGTVIVQCNCQRDKGVISLVIVTGMGNTSVCHNCGKLFHFSSFRIENNAVVPVIDIALPTELGKVM